MRAVVRVGASGISEPGAHASLRLWTPLGAHVTVLREIVPTTRDLRNGATVVDDRTKEYPAGRWTDGARAYELAVGVPARAAGDEMLAARLTLVVDGQVVGPALIAVAWTGDERLIAATAGPTGSPNTAGAATAELPTGRSPRPRHTLTGDAPGRSCPGCGLRSADGDRFCEGCGRELFADEQPR
ncbi:MAG: hypothetical protein QOD69_3078 [Solirubrobacteraceae bacterium]|nr:hypothetical protein [Solirubrobacteraceae bacterium]